MVRRLRLFLRRGKLNAELAAGESPGVSPDITLRAGQLTAPKNRHRLAETLRAAVADAERAGPRWGSVVPVCRNAVALNRGGLLGLADRLDGSAAVCACGVARACALLYDGTSALYNPNAEPSLTDLIWWIADGLDCCSCWLAAQPAAAPHGACARCAVALENVDRVRGRS